MKNVYQKTFELPRVTLQEKGKIPIDFLIDEIDVDSYFFHNFLDVFIVQNRVIRLSKGLFRETYSIKEFTFDPQIAYQCFKLTAELHLTRKEILFIFENLKLIKKSYDNKSKTLFIPYQKTKFVKTPQQSSLFLHFFKDFQSSKSCLIRFGIRFPEVCFENFVIFELSSQIYIKIKELDYLLKNQQFLTKNSINLMKKVAEMLLLLIFFLLLLISAIFLIFTANNFWSFIFAIASVYIFTYLEDLSP